MKKGLLDCFRNRYNCIIVIISIVVCFASVIGGELDYAGGDDYFRNLVSSGAFGDKFCYYIPFSNVLYGIPIAILNLVVPCVDWFFVMMILLNLASIVTINLIIASKILSNGDFAIKRIIVTFIAAVINIVLARDCYVSVQFTKCATLWIVTGIICFIYSIMINRNKVLGVLFGMFLFFYGASCRIECFYMCMPFMLTLAFVVIVQKKLKHESINKRNIVSAVLIVVILLSILQLSECLFRFNNPEWKVFWEYNHKSSVLRDYYGINYDHNQAAYDSINTDENDIELYNNWLFADTDFFSAEWYDKVALIEEAYSNNGIRFDGNILKESLENLVQAWNHAPFASKGVVAFAYLFVLLVFVFGNRFARMYSIMNLGMLYVIYWYFTCVGRTIWRAEYSAFVSMVVFLLLYGCLCFDFNVRIKNNLGKLINRLNKKHIYNVLLLFSIFIMLVYSMDMMYNWYFFKDKHIVKNEADISGRLYSFNENDENIYALTDLYVSNNPMSITRAKYHNTFKNVVYLCGWLVPSPTGMEATRSVGIDNPMRALVEEDNVYLHSTDETIPELIRIHLQKTLNKGVGVKNLSDDLYYYFYTSLY